VCGRIDRIAFTSEHLDHHPAEILFVINDQDRFASPVHLLLQAQHAVRLNPRMASSCQESSWQIASIAAFVLFASESEFIMPESDKHHWQSTDDFYIFGLFSTRIRSGDRVIHEYSE
jgi:hypothetical protein